MVSINTNLSSLVVQQNMTRSTNALNTALERMTTGFKLNHASDNAANYSIATNMDSQMSGYDIAEDNIAMGMDMVTSAMDTISVMLDRGERLYALWTQAQNGTYDEQSINAIQQEVDSIIADINRVYNSAEYNGISLLDTLPAWAQTVREDAGVIKVQYDGFIEQAHTIDDSVVNAMTHVDGLSSFESGETYAVSSKEDLKQLATLVNSGNDTTNVTFVMGADIDLNGEEWTAIGESASAKRFKGTFDGNGHTISNLNINREDESYQGLFGCTDEDSTIKNVSVENANVNGDKYTGSLVGHALRSNINNCYATSTVSGSTYTGGLIGGMLGSINNCYSKSTVTSTEDYTGGLIGGINNISVSNCFSESTVTSTGSNVGGLIGRARGASSINNCYSEGAVTVSSSGSMAGGLIGRANNIDIVSNSYSTSSVTGNSYTGGLIGEFIGTLINCYATGNVVGKNATGGLVGLSYSNTVVSNSFATGNVTGTTGVGGCIGRIGGTDHSTTSTNTNIYSSGTVNGTSRIGSLIGRIYYYDNSSTISITNGFVKEQNMNIIGDIYDPSSTGETMEEFLANIRVMSSTTKLQVGIYGNDSNSIYFDSSFNFDLKGLKITSDEAYSKIQTFLDTLNDCSTRLGSVYNKLESALESTAVSKENLTSSLSTIRDTDVAKESSAYIKSQILQQASATLLATANQTPSIALQLL